MLTLQWILSLHIYVIVCIHTFKGMAKLSLPLSVFNTVVGKLGNDSDSLSEICKDFNIETNNGANLRYCGDAT